MEAEECAPSMSGFKTIQNSYLWWSRSKTKLKVVLEHAVTQVHTHGSYSLGAWGSKSIKLEKQQSADFSGLNAVKCFNLWVY